MPGEVGHGQGASDVSSTGETLSLVKISIKKPSRKTVPVECTHLWQFLTNSHLTSLFIN